jgi:hypothetical protein
VGSNVIIHESEQLFKRFHGSVMQTPTVDRLSQLQSGENLVQEASCEETQKKAFIMKKKRLHISFKTIENIH